MTGQVLRSDHRVADAKGRGMQFWMDRLGLTGLRRAGVEFVGPCPICGGDDRFGVNVRKGQFLCRKCGAKGDEIGLVMFVQGLKFVDALDWMCGPRQEITADELAARAKRDAENTARKDREAAQYRARAIAQAGDIWAAGMPFAGSPAEAYLRMRGIVVPSASQGMFRFVPALNYMVSNPDKSSRETYLRAHVGPAMLAMIVGQNDRLCAVHRTWFDLAAPHGKVRIVHPVTGEIQPRKKGWGSKKGGAIRLVRGFEGNTTMVMGEGIETTFSAYMAGLFEGAHFWAGVDLGNMAGRRIMVGQGMKYAGQPDLTDNDAFVPPAWVRRLIYIQDGDSELRMTRANLLAGLRRAKHFIPNLRIQIAECPRGFDLNDVLLGEVNHGAG